MSERLTDEQLRGYQSGHWVTPNYDEIDSMAGELLALRAHVAKLEAALGGLVQRIDEIGNDPDFKTMQTVFYTHGFKYGGPSWAEALEEARAALKDAPNERA